MVGLYIASTRPRAGKSLLSLSLGTLLQQQGFSVAYMKPVGQHPQTVDDRLGDADANIIQEVLGQRAPADTVTPTLIPSSLHALSVFTIDTDLIEKIHAAYTSLSENKDVTIVSGSGAFPHTGMYCGADGLTVSNKLGLQTILIEKFSDSFSYDCILSASALLGNKLLGVVLNAVPQKRMLECTEILCPYLESKGINVLGVIPYTPSLSAIRISELAYSLEGYIAAGNNHASNMVEGYIIGAMQVNNFMTFLRRRGPSSAVVVGGDRADLQLAAIHATVSCLVLTGNHPPCELVRVKAEALGVPIICVKQDTFSASKSMATLLESKKIRDLQQIRLATELVKEALDFSPITALIQP